MAETDKTQQAKLEAKKAQQSEKADRAKKAAKAEGAKAEGGKKLREERVAPRLASYFEETVRAKLTEQFGYSNRMQVPVIDKIVLNMGIGEGVNDRKKVDQAAADLGLIAGQKAIITKSRKSVANFKLRDGQAIGCKVTLRRARMYEFIDRLIDYDKAAEVWGMDITVCTTARNDDEARALLAAFNFPFRQ